MREKGPCPRKRLPKASLEPAYILGDRKLIPETANAVECLENRTPRRDSQEHGRILYVTRLLHCRAHNLARHEAVDSTARRE